MKRIILDFYRRWGLGLVAILVVQYFLERYAAEQGSGGASVTKIFSCQILMFMGFILTGDLFRGQGKVLAILPVTALQSGRALWIASVLIPGMALSVVSVICLVLYAHRSVAEILAPAQLLHWATFPLILGASFGALTLMPSVGGAPTVLDRLRAGASGLKFIVPIAGWFYLQKQPVNPILAGLVVLGLVFVAVRGWLRAGQLIAFPSGFRASSAPGPKPATMPLAMSGVGGLRYLVQQTLVRTVLMGLAMMTLIAIVLSAMRGNKQSLDFSQSLVAAINGGLTPYIFLLIMGSVPVAQQLRFFRTLPISPLTLTAVVIFLPIASVTAVGTILALVLIPLAGQAALFPLLNSFLSIAGIAAVGMTMIVWRGIDTLTFLVLFLLMVIGPILSLALNLAFSIRAIPFWVSVIIPVILMTVSFFITHRLISRSSAAYRVRPATPYAWAQLRTS